MAEAHHAQDAAVEVSLDTTTNHQDGASAVNISTGEEASPEESPPESPPTDVATLPADENKSPPYEELEYAMKSYHAIVQPVFITMVLSALAVVYIQTPESLETNAEALSGTYLVYRSDGESSNSQELGQSLINALVIVGGICVATFVIVLLYKYRCMKCLLGYMILASLLLLATLSAVLFQVAIDKYQINMDKITFYGILYNVSVVGTASIFYPHGFPTYIAQGALVWTSVLVAWQFSHFEDWTAWALLVMLAIYDLFAVLTPCGPLKALVKLMSASDAPAMPGLLYEANLQGRKAPKKATTETSSSSSAPSQTRAAQPSANGAEEPPSNQQQQEAAAETTISQPSVEPAVQQQQQPNASSTVLPLAQSSPQGETDASESVADNVEAPPVNDSNLCHIPFALAKVYKLPLADDEGRPLSLAQQPIWMQPADTDNPPAPVEYTVQELRKLVPVLFPPRGGRIRPRQQQDNTNEMIRYSVTDSKGLHKRTLFVNENGKVFEESQPGMLEDDGPSFKSRHSIRLGLGDFIFYSILVAKAALYSWASFWACVVVILAGLGSTLALLALYRQALPALPISIFGGVVFYLLTRYLVEDWLIDILKQGAYV